MRLNMQYNGDYTAPRRITLTGATVTTQTNVNRTQKLLKSIIRSTMFRFG
jgi:negative regulator of replication initiation